IHQYGTDWPNERRPRPLRWTATGPRPQDRATPTQERSACVTDRPRLEDSRDFERQFPAQPGRLSRPVQRLYFPAWDEALAHTPSYSRNSILHGVIDGRAPSE